MELISLKKNSSFSIREGWLEKAIQYIKLDSKCFSPDKGTKIFGIGSAMVKSLRFWATASGIIKFNKGEGKLTEFGEALAKEDPFLEKKNSWWLIHTNLVLNKELNPVFYYFFQSENRIFEKESLVIYLNEIFSSVQEISETSLNSDISVLFKTYVESSCMDPENNLNCPLNKLKLLKEINRKYEKVTPEYNELSAGIIMNLLMNYKDEFNLGDFIESEISPIKIFNLTRPAFYGYLDELRNKGYINLIKTAGLNTIKILKKPTIEEIIKFGE